MRTHLPLVWLVCLAAFSAGSLPAANPLITEVENLLQNLKAEDPARSTLTLRLGDLYFEEAGQVSKKAAPTETDVATARRFRASSLRYYAEALKDQKLNSAVRTKVKFQIARLYAEEGRDKEAAPLWQELAGQSAAREIQQEAVLRLAEAAEKAGNTAAAETHYRRALGLCAGSDLCAFAHYRLGWISYQSGDLQKAVTEMELALFDAKGQIREEALRDYIVFLSRRSGGGEDELKRIEALVEKLSRPGLFAEMANAFLSSGNKPAGVRVLSYSQSKTPSLAGKVRLLEEVYGLRDWDKFRSLCEELGSSTDGTPAANTATAEKLDSESEKILRRLLVQLDGERITKKEHAQDFKNVSLVYLRHFPTHAQRLKVLEGWIAAEESPQNRIAQLGKWLKDPALELSREERLKLHLFRAANGEKVGDFTLVESEMAALVALSPQASTTREYKFKRAYALSRQGQNAGAILLLKDLATTANATDSWVIKAQQLLVEILGTQKDYDTLITQAELWLSDGQVQSAARTNAELRKFLGELGKVTEVARFERAAALGETPAALQQFRTFCADKKYLPKSCENTRILATKLKDQDALLFALSALGEERSLAEEYEASALFAEAAATRERAKGGLKDSPEFLRVALLYELAGKNSERDRILGQLRQRLQKSAKVDVDEAILFETVKEAKLFSLAWLKLSWSAPFRARIASEMQSQGMGTKEVRQILLQTTSAAGPGWASVVLAEAESLAAVERGIAFYGKNSRRKFEDRLAKLKRFADFAEKYLPGADVETRVALLTKLTTSYQTLAATIEASPLPEGLSPEDTAQVTASLKEMAAPFHEKATQFEKLKGEQTLAKASEPSQAPSAHQALMLPEEAKATLRKDPDNLKALAELKKYYQAQGQERLASYFEGRLKQLGKQEGQNP